MHGIYERIGNLSYFQRALFILFLNLLFHRRLVERWIVHLECLIIPKYRNVQSRERYRAFFSRPPLSLIFGRRSSLTTCLLLCDGIFARTAFVRFPVLRSAPCCSRTRFVTRRCPASSFLSPFQRCYEQAGVTVSTPLTAADAFVGQQSETMRLVRQRELIAPTKDRSKIMTFIMIIVPLAHSLDIKYSN